MRLLIAAILLSATQAGAIVNGYVDEDPRYDAIGAFGLASGLMQGHSWWCSAVLIRPDVALVAKHCIEPLNGYPAAIRFRRNVDGSIGSIDMKPETFHNVAVASFYAPEFGYIALAYLSEPVKHIRPIPCSFIIAPTHEPVILAGWGREGPQIAQGPLREQRLCDSDLYFSSEYFIYFNSAWDGGVRCGPNSGDSGGPILYGVGDDMSVVGVIGYSSGGTALAQYVNDPQINQPQFTGSGE